MNKFFCMCIGAVLLALAACGQRPEPLEPPPPPSKATEGYAVGCDNNTHNFFVTHVYPDGTSSITESFSNGEAQLCFNQADGTILMINKDLYAQHLNTYKQQQAQQQAPAASTPQ